MFFAIILIAVGVAILLNTAGILSGYFWSIFWGVFFIALGIKLMIKKGGCPMCNNMWWGGKMHSHMHGRNHECCQHNHNEETKN